MIKKLEQYGQLTPEEKDAITGALGRTSEIGPRHDIVREGDQASESCLLLEGFAYRHNTLPDGRRQITAFHVPGDFCDLHSFLLKKMDDGVGTLTKCKVGFFPHKALRQITNDYPYLTRVLWLTTLIDGAVHREWMTALGRMSAEERLAHLFCELFVRLESVGLTRDKTYAFPVTQAELGDGFGMSTVHANRSIMSLRESGLIELENRTLRILDWDRLRDLAHFNPDYLHIEQQVERD
jgi:CRP-like cAMP-binding protein